MISERESRLEAALAALLAEVANLREDYPAEAWRFNDDVIAEAELAISMPTQGRPIACVSADDLLSPEEAIAKMAGMLEGIEYSGRISPEAHQFALAHNLVIIRGEDADTLHIDGVVDCIHHGVAWFDRHGLLPAQDDVGKDKQIGSFHYRLRKHYAHSISAFWQAQPEGVGDHEILRFKSSFIQYGEFKMNDCGDLHGYGMVISLA